MVNFFSKFIPNFADMSEPLNGPRRKDMRFVWGPEQEAAFMKLEEAIASPQVLAMADFFRKFILKTNACGTAVAAVLPQDHPESWKPVAYVSRTLNAQESNTPSMNWKPWLFCME